MGKRPLQAVIVLVLTFVPAVGNALAPAQPKSYSLPVVDLSDETQRRTVVDREGGQYLGHPTTVLLEDNRTMPAVYPKGHGRGAIVVKRSTDAGLTWSDRLPTPENGDHMALFHDEGRTWSEPRELPAALTDLYVSGSDGYHTYRIPSLLVTKRGTLLAFCEGRKGGRGDSGDIDLLVKRSDDRAKTWSHQEIVWDDGANTCGNPCPVVDRQTGTIWLTMTWNHGQDKESQIMQNAGKDTRRVFVTRSDDDGLTWSRPQEITDTAKRPEWRWYATGPGVGIQLERGPWRGRLLVPCDHSLVSAEDPSGYNSHVIFSDDHGRTWQPGGTIRPAVNECQVVELTDGTLLMNMRNYDRSATTRAIATSRDGGLTWSQVRHDPALVEPICQASLVRYDWQRENGSDCLLFANPAHGESGVRRDMTVRLSRDGGKTWPVERLLWPGPAAYSCLAVLPDGAIACLFEGGPANPYERIVLARFDCRWLTGARREP